MELLPLRLDEPRVAKLGANLRELRDERERTQEELAGRSGVQAGEISRIEAANAPLAFRLCRAWPRGCGSHRKALELRERPGSCRHSWSKRTYESLLPLAGRTAPSALLLGRPTN
jgi:DNA-binding XRE family transcriptional regulator